MIHPCRPARIVPMICAALLTGTAQAEEAEWSAYYACVNLHIANFAFVVESVDEGAGSSRRFYADRRRSTSPTQCGSGRSSKACESARR